MEVPGLAAAGEEDLVKALWEEAWGLAVAVWEEVWREVWRLAVTVSSWRETCLGWMGLAGAWRRRLWG